MGWPLPPPLGRGLILLAALIIPLIVVIAFLPAVLT
jgi:hypothetical protein